MAVLGGAGASHGSQTFSTAGTHTFVAQSYSLTVLLFGAGQAGYDYGAAGGEGGQIVCSRLDTVPGETVTISLGAGGAAVSNGGVGGDSTITSAAGSLTAHGGGNYTSNLAAGVAGSPSGTNGANSSFAKGGAGGSANGSSGGGGGAASYGAGGNGGNGYTSATAGGSGVNGGGGGGGGGGGAGNASPGGAGGDGYCEIYW